MRVAILGTGRMELLGLPPALHALFPGHGFYPVYANPIHAQPFDSFTSSGQPLSSTQANTNLVAIVEEMAAALVPGRKGEPAPDLLVVQPVSRDA